eukprot:gene17703-43198_t
MPGFKELTSAIAAPLSLQHCIDAVDGDPACRQDVVVWGYCGPNYHELMPKPASANDCFHAV